MIFESSVTISFNLAEAKEVDSAYSFYEKIRDDKTWKIETLSGSIARFTKKESFEM